MSAPLSAIQVTRLRVPKHLPPVRRKLFLALAVNFGRFVPLPALVDALYGEAEDGGPDWFKSAITGHIWHLRRHLKAHGFEIESRYGGGYRLIGSATPSREAA